jgi:lipopolysaccharide assembly outer membrane protein LptD (OstA)
MKIVDATFYLKDGTVLYISSKNGIYNNKTLDMEFKDSVKANYQDSELFAEKADYSNSESYLSIYEDVRVNDKTGNLIADKLLFDITNQTLDITAFNNGEINANVKLNEKRF